MSIETVFYIVGLVLTAGALLVSFVGLKAKNFPGRGALFGILTVFLALVVATCGLAVAVARKEQDERRHEQAVAAKEAEESGEAATTEDSTEGEAAGEADSGDGGDAATAGSGGTLELRADETALAYDKTELEVAAGEVTVNLDNPSAIPHDVAIRDDSGEQIAATDVVSQATTSLTTTLEPGEYQFFCTVPGHEQAGMVGTLKVG